jgi:hypothetical protein
MSSKIGRPTREEALHKAIAAFGGVGIDRKLVKPWDIIAAIAADPEMEPSIRLRAAVALTEAPLKTAQEEQEQRYREMAERRAAWEEADEAGRAQLIEEASHAALASRSVG